MFINIQIDKEPEHIRLAALTPALLGNWQVSKLKGEALYAAISSDTPSRGETGCPVSGVSIVNPSPERIGSASRRLNAESTPSIHAAAEARENPEHVGNTGKI